MGLDASPQVHTALLALALTILGSRLVLAAPRGQRPSPDSAKRIVIPFDFESKFDNGEYGQNMGDMFWAKLKRQGGFILPESMQEVRDWCQRNAFVPSPDTPLGRMKEIIVKEQAGDIGIWGKVERVQGFETDVYDLAINIADFTVDPPRMIYQRKAHTRTVSEIPHVYVKEALDRLYGRNGVGCGRPRSQAPGALGEGAELGEGRLRARPESPARLGQAAAGCHLGLGQAKECQSQEPVDPLHDG